MKRKGDAQKLLYENYKNVLFTICYKYSNNLEDAEDNLHNTFIEIFTNIEKYKGLGSFEGWMKRIAINKSIESYKKTYHLTPLYEEKITDVVAIEEYQIEKIELNALLNLIKELPDQYRLVFTLYELDDYSHQEISEMLSISVNTSKSNLHRAKVLLKSKIEKFNNTLNFDTVRYGK